MIVRNLLFENTLKPCWSIFDTKRHVGPFAADSKGSVDEPRAAHHRADPVRQRVAFLRIADKTGVEPAVVVFVVVSANSIRTWYQVVENHGQRFGCRLQFRVLNGIIAVRKPIGLREERDI